MSVRQAVLGRRREIRRERCPSLFFHVGLHLMGMRLLRRVSIWRARLWHAVVHVLLVLRVVDSGLWHIGITVDLLRVVRDRATVRLSHVWPHSSHVVPRRRPRTHMGWLRSMSSVYWVSRVRYEGAILDWRRS